MCSICFTYVQWKGYFVISYIVLTIENIKMNEFGEVWMTR